METKEQSEKRLDRLFEFLERVWRDVQSYRTKAGSLEIEFRKHSMNTEREHEGFRQGISRNEQRLEHFHQRLDRVEEKVGDIEDRNIAESGLNWTRIGIWISAGIALLGILIGAIVALYIELRQ